ncbi:MAG: hypothetical protein Kow0092_17690 [Deferrisomatales bacterium]
MSEWIYGRRTVAEHLAAAPATCRRIWVAEGARLPPELLRAAQAAGAPVETVARVRLDEVSTGGNHQGVAAEVGGWRYAAFEELVERARSPGRTPLIVALDCVQDPRNLGAVLRVADGVGAAGVVIPKDRAAGLSAAVARTAAGAVASVPVARVVNLARSLDRLREEGFWVLGTAATAPSELHRVPVAFPCVVVLGGEEKGVRPNVAKRFDRAVAIPMRGAVASLNVAVACGVVCYEVLRQHRLGSDGAFSP